jgi:hypothetical protein
MKVFYYRTIKILSQSNIRLYAYKLECIDKKIIKKKAEKKLHESNAKHFE